MNQTNSREFASGSRCEESRLKVIARWLAVYTETYPGYGETPSPSKCEAYAVALDDIQPEILDEAMRRASRDCARFPVPAEIRQLAGAVEIERRKAATDASAKILDGCQTCKGLGFVPDPAKPNTSRLCACRSDKSRALAAKALMIDPTPDDQSGRIELVAGFAKAVARMKIQ